MKQQLETIRQAAMAALDKAATPAELEDLRVRLLGKKGLDKARGREARVE